ncbi:MAG: elongation factor G, partial [Planctomycetota bacterium]
MAKFESKDIRSLAIAGHGSSGKTTLVDGILCAGKSIKKMGSVDDGSTVTDFDEYEKETKHSIDLGLAHTKHKGKRIYLLDTPGYPDFIGDAIAGLSAADTVLIAVDSQDGVRVNTRQIWEQAEALGLPRAMAITRIDLEHAKWDERVLQIQESFGEACVPFTIPQGETVGTGVTGVEVVYPMADDASDAAKKAAGAIIERAVETDDELMMKYLEGEELTPDEINTAVHAAVRSGNLVPIFASAAEKAIGTKELMDAVCSIFPRADERVFAAKSADGDDDVEVTADSPFTARIFRVSYDPFVGKIAYARITSGTLAGSSAVNYTGGKGTMKLGHIYRVFGKDEQEIEGEAVAGDIIAVNKHDELKAGTAMFTGDLRIRWPEQVFPEPTVGVAAEPRSRADDSKIMGAMQKLIEGDATLSAERVRETKELVVKGMSNLHLDTLFHRMKSRYQVEVETHLPKVPYMETITARGEADYRHKKQTGGAGQFAHVYLRIEPVTRGEGFSFRSEVVGGAISSSFLPSIEKGIRQVMDEGIIAGFPFVDCAAVVYDGKEHPVDSKDIAFQIAGRNAFREAVQSARPVLLEPIEVVTITAPQDYTGAIMGDLNTRRGRIQNTGQRGSFVVVDAQVPLAEMLTYSTELRSMTGGEGSFTMKHSHYDVVPKHITDQVVVKHKKEQ